MYNLNFEMKSYFGNFSIFANVIAFYIKYYYFANLPKSYLKNI